MKLIGTMLHIIFVLVILGIAGLFAVSLLPISNTLQIKIVKSGSMEPAIHTGAVVAVMPAPNYEIGDVITFGEDSSRHIPTTHRIIAIQGEGSNSVYTTQGDANEDPDPEPTTRSEIIGKVLFTVPGAGYVLDFARKPLGFSLLIGIPAGIIIFEELLRIFSEVKRMRRGPKPTPIALRRTEEESEAPKSSDTTRTLDLRHL